jgi:hypothetical protein
VRSPGCYGPRVSTSEREGASVGHPNEDLEVVPSVVGFGWGLVMDHMVRR